MIHYVDSSALVKRYVTEEGSTVLLDLAEPMAVSEIARVELASAWWRRVRTEAGDPDAVAVLQRAFESDAAGWGDHDPVVQLVRVDQRILDAAARVVGRHDLRSLDAVHLATAEILRHSVDPSVTMVAFDRRLRAAAAAEGFALVPTLLD